MNDEEAPERTETEEAPGGKSAPNIGMDREYIFSPKGIIKMIEFFLLLVAFATCASFKNAITGGSHISAGKADFFLFISVVSWLYVIVLFIGGATGVIRKLEHKYRDLVICIVHGNIALFLLLSSAMIADEAVRTARYPNLCELIREHTSTTCAVYDTAVAFGLFSMIVFVVDAVLYFFDWKRHYSQ